MGTLKEDYNVKISPQMSFWNKQFINENTNINRIYQYIKSL